MHRGTTLLQEEWNALEKRTIKIEDELAKSLQISQPLQGVLKRFSNSQGSMSVEQLYQELKDLDEFFAENAEGITLDLILVYSSFLLTG